MDSYARTRLFVLLIVQLHGWHINNLLSLIMEAIVYSELLAIDNAQIIGFVVDNHPTLRWKLRRPFLGFGQAFSVLSCSKKKACQDRLLHKSTVTYVYCWLHNCMRRQINNLPSLTPLFVLSTLDATHIISYSWLSVLQVMESWVRPGNEPAL